MSNDLQTTSNDQTPTPVSKPSKIWLLWIVLLFAIPLFLVFRNNKDEQQYPVIRRAELVELLNHNAQMSGTIRYPPPGTSSLVEILGEAKITNSAGQGTTTRFRLKTRLNAELENQLLAKGFETAEPNTVVMSLFVTLLPILLVALIIYIFFIRQINRNRRPPDR